MRKKKISARQLAANRRNARKSTGPRTLAGREAVSLNAVKHGLRGDFGLLPGEDRIVYATHCRELIAELVPGTALEFSLAQTIANDLWRLDRASAIETNVFALGLAEDGIEDNQNPDDPDMQQAFSAARTFLNHTGKFALLSLYEQRLNCRVRKNFAELRRSQAERAMLQAERARSQAERAKAIAPKLNPINDLQTKNAQNGFERANYLFAGIPAREAA